MKVQKLILLDIEVAERVKQEENASGLINNLLIKHYKDFRSEEEIIEEVKQKIKDRETKETEYDKYNNPKHKAKRLKEMIKAKKKRDKEVKK